MACEACRGAPSSLCLCRFTAIILEHNHLIFYLRVCEHVWMRMVVVDEMEGGVSCLARNEVKSAAGSVAAARRRDNTRRSGRLTGRLKAVMPSRRNRKTASFRTAAAVTVVVNHSRPVPRFQYITSAFTRRTELTYALAAESQPALLSKLFHSISLS